MLSDRSSTQKSCSIDDRLNRMENSIEILERIIERHEEEIKDLRSKIPKKIIKALGASSGKKEKGLLKVEQKGRFTVSTVAK